MISKETVSKKKGGMLVVRKGKAGFRENGTERKLPVRPTFRLHESNTQRFFFFVSLVADTLLLTLEASMLVDSRLAAPSGDVEIKELAATSGGTDMASSLFSCFVCLAGIEIGTVALGLGDELDASVVAEVVVVGVAGGGIVICEFKIASMFSPACSESCAATS